MAHPKARKSKRPTLPCEACGIKSARAAADAARGRPARCSVCANSSLSTLECRLCGGSGHRVEACTTPPGLWLVRCPRGCGALLFAREVTEHECLPAKRIEDYAAERREQ